MKILYLKSNKIEINDNNNNKYCAMILKKTQILIVLKEIKQF